MDLHCLPFQQNPICTGTSLGHFFQEEIASPLGLDFYIRLPEEIPNSRFATLEKPTVVERLLNFPFRLTLAALNPRSHIYRALVTNPGSALPHDERRVYAQP